MRKIKTSSYLKISCGLYVLITFLATSCIILFFSVPAIESNILIRIFCIKIIESFAAAMYIENGFTTIVIILFVLLFILLFVSDIFIFFSRWGTLFPILLLSLDVFFNLFMIIKSVSVNYDVIIGTMFEFIGIFLMIIYIVKGKKKISEIEMTV